MKEESLGEYIPADDTGFSKYVCTRMMNGIPGYVNVRFFGIFGRYEDYAIRFISNAVCKAIFDLPITLRQDKRFDYTSVRDGVRAIGRFLCARPESLRYNDYNVTPDRTVSLLELHTCKGNSGQTDLPSWSGLRVRARLQRRQQKVQELFPIFPYSIEESIKDFVTVCIHKGPD
jgi:GDP-L-fucose synthase